MFTLYQGVWGNPLTTRATEALAKADAERRAGHALEWAPLPVDDNSHVLGEQEHLYFIAGDDPSVGDTVRMTRKGYAAYTGRLVALSTRVAQVQGQDFEVRPFSLALWSMALA